ncbi:hypothetical protein N2152v2_003160 [Parachlorella kessleri]
MFANNADHPGGLKDCFWAAGSSREGSPIKPSQALGEVPPRRLITGGEPVPRRSIQLAPASPPPPPLHGQGQPCLRPTGQEAGSTAAAAALAAAAPPDFASLLPFLQAPRAGPPLHRHLSLSNCCEHLSLPTSTTLATAGSAVASPRLPSMPSCPVYAFSSMPSSSNSWRALDSAMEGSLPLRGSQKELGASRGRGSPASQAGPATIRKSKYRGVQWEKGCNKWRARIHTDKTRHIGYFDSEEAAAKAWDLAALKHYGLSWKAKLNMPDVTVPLFKQHSQEAPAAGAGPGGKEAGSAQDSTPAPRASRQYRGVQQENKRFKAVVQTKNSKIVVGVFDTAEEAARAYDRESLRLNGRGAITNFPLSDYSPELDRWQEAYFLATATPSPGPLLASPSSLPSPQGLPRAAHAGLGGPGADSGGLVSPRYYAFGGVASEVGGSGGPHCRQGKQPREATGVTRVGQSHLPLGAPGQDLKRPRLAFDGGEVTTPVAPSKLLPSPTLPAGLSEQGPGGTVTGVMQDGDRWKAYLTVDLGSYHTAQDAAKAYARASLWAQGLCGPLPMPLQEALTLAAGAAVDSTAEEAARSGRVQGFRGVVQRPEGYMALLDIGGQPFDLGPFSTAREAAQFYDRYSLLLHGLLAKTNFPPSQYMAPASEVRVLADTVLAVKQEAQHAQQRQQHEQHYGRPQTYSVELGMHSSPQGQHFAAQQCGGQPLRAVQAAQAPRVTGELSKHSSWRPEGQQPQQLEQPSSCGPSHVIFDRDAAVPGSARAGPLATAFRADKGSSPWADHPSRVAVAGCSTSPGGLFSELSGTSQSLTPPKAPLLLDSHCDSPWLPTRPLETCGFAAPEGLAATARGSAALPGMPSLPTDEPMALLANLFIPTD